MNDNDEQHRRRESDKDPTMLILWRLDQLSESLNSMRVEMLGNQKSLSDELKMIKSDCDERHNELLRVEGRVNGIDSKIADSVLPKLNKHDEHIVWLVRLIIGAVISAVLALVLINK